MANHRINNRAGLEFDDPGFRPFGRILLRLLFGLPPSVRERLLFNSSAVCVPLQKVLQRSLGGSFTVETRFTAGPLLGRAFECSSSEKYFMLGSTVEHEVQDFFRKLISPGDIVYDVGGHIGYMALLFAVLCGERGRVFTFEPSPINFSRLMRNIELNRGVMISAAQTAVSDTEGTVHLLEQSSQSSIAPEGKQIPGEGTPVRTICLDNFVFCDNNPPPKFVKIDIEGHAGQCLTGMRRILSEHRPLMVLEIHHTMEADRVSTVLDQHCYNVVILDAPDEFPRRILAKPL